MPAQREVGAGERLGRRLLVTVLADVNDAEGGEQAYVLHRPGLGHHDERDVAAVTTRRDARAVDARLDRGEVARELGPAVAHAGAPASQASIANRPVRPSRR